jgi:excisionase family DNA binding protein
MAQQLVQQGLLNPQAQSPQPAPSSPATPGNGGSPSNGFDLLSPADAAKMLGVSEADVIATIESGDLKAKKIGTAYRISKAALQEFINK